MWPIMRRFVVLHCNSIRSNSEECSPLPVCFARFSCARKFLHKKCAHCTDMLALPMFCLLRTARVTVSKEEFLGQCSKGLVSETGMVGCSPTLLCNWDLRRKWNYFRQSCRQLWETGLLPEALRFCGSLRAGVAGQPHFRVNSRFSIAISAAVHKKLIQQWQAVNPFCGTSQGAANGSIWELQAWDKTWPRNWGKGAVALEID